MRKINTGDAFKLARIIKGSGKSMQLATLFADAEGKSEKDLEQLGMKAIVLLMEGCADQEDKLYELLGGIIGKSAKTIEEQSLTETIEDIKAIVKENDIESFFKQANQLSQ